MSRLCIERTAFTGWSVFATYSLTYFPCMLWVVVQRIRYIYHFPKTSWREAFPSLSLPFLLQLVQTPCVMENEGKGEGGHRCWSLQHDGRSSCQEGQGGRRRRGDASVLIITTVGTWMGGVHIMGRYLHWWEVKASVLACLSTVHKRD